MVGVSPEPTTGPDDHRAGFQPLQKGFARRMHVPTIGTPRSLFLLDKFWLLRRVSTLLKFAAWFFLGAGVLATGVAVAMGIVQHELNLHMAASTLAFVVSIAVLFVYLLALSEWIQMMLDIEENTRRSTVVLTELLTRMYPQAAVPPLVPGPIFPPVASGTTFSGMPGPTPGAPDYPDTHI